MNSYSSWRSKIAIPDTVLIASKLAIKQRDALEILLASSKESLSSLRGSQSTNSILPIKEEEAKLNWVITSKKIEKATKREI